MGIKITLLLIFTLVPLSFFATLYFLNPTIVMPMLQGAKQFTFTAVGNFIQSVKKDPATAIVPVLGAISLIGGLTYKVVGKIKAKAAAAELVAERSQSQTYQIGDALKQEIQKNTELEKKLAVYKKDGDAVTALKEINSELRLENDNLKRNSEIAINQVTAERETIRREFQTFLKTMFTDPNVKKNIETQQLYDKYVVQT